MIILRAIFAAVGGFKRDAFSMIRAPLFSLPKVSSTSFLLRTVPDILATLPEKLLSLSCISRISAFASVNVSSSSSPVISTLPVLFSANTALGNYFNLRVDIEALDDEALVAYAKQYAEELEYSIDEFGILALHTRIADMQTSDHEVPEYILVSLRNEYLVLFRLLDLFFNCLLRLLLD